MKSCATVLLVDDEASVLSGLLRVLRAEPYDLLTASGGADALGLLEQKSIDVVVSDERMPAMTGTELLSRIRERWPHVVRIMLTGKRDLAVAQNAINQGEVHRFLTKPCNSVDLAGAIRSALELSLLKRESLRMLGCLRAQSEQLESLEAEHPGISSVSRDTSGAIVIEDEDMLGDLEALLAEIRVEVQRAEGNRGGER
ncbi:MAG: response regulator [Myxococcota bacterium]